VNTPIVLSDGKKCYTGENCAWHFPSAENLEKGLDKKLSALDKGVKANPLAKLAPEKIDGVLAELYYQRYGLEVEIAGYQKMIDRNEQLLKRGNKTPRYIESIANIQAKYNQEINNRKEEIAGFYAEEDIYEAEYHRRGRWTRAFLVHNGNGHVHKSRSCSTLRPTTSLLWVTSYSGKNESEVIEDAGESACTVCYPNAPVDTRNRPSKITDPNVKAINDEKEKARAERERVKSEKAAKLALTSISTPEGKDLYTQSYGYIKSARTAEIEAVNHQEDIIANDNGTRIIPNTAMMPIYRKDYQTLLEALAHKKGVSVEEEDAYLKNKAQIKHVKTQKEIAKLRQQYPNY
jgi:hypothetical protein